MVKGNSLYFVCSVLALLLYIYAPNKVDWGFQVICSVLFSFQSFFIIKGDVHKEGWLNFNLIFIFSFFFVTYAFPLFLLMSTLNNPEGIEAFIDFNVSSKCSALCTLGISVYFYSYKKRRRKLFDFSNLIKSYNFSGIVLIFIIIFISLFYYSIQYYQTVKGINVDSGFLNSLYLVSLPLALMYNCKKNKINGWLKFVRVNILILILAFTLDLLYFFIGDRGLIIYSTIEIVAVYSILVKRIRSSYFVIGITIGVLLMFVIRETRTTKYSIAKTDTSVFAQEADNIVSNSDALSVFSDLTGIHRELYIGYEYVEAKGFLKPMQIVIVPFYPIPLVPNLISEALFNKTMNEIKPGLVLNEYMAYSGHGHFGIHCIIDLYMRWGVLGVVFFFYLWGYLVACLTKYKNKNIIGTALYIILISNAIGIPRQPLLDMMRTLSYVLIIAWLLSFIPFRGSREMR